MSNLEKMLQALEKRNLKVNVSQDGVELLELRTNDKNIEVEIKNREEFKKLMKELRK